MNSVSRFFFYSILSASCSTLVLGDSLDDQISRMAELQAQQKNDYENLKSRAEKNRLPEYKQKQLDSERERDRGERERDREERERNKKEYYQNELMLLKLEEQRLKMRVAKSKVEATDFTYETEKNKIDLKIRQLAAKNRSLDVELKEKRVTQDEHFKIDIELRRLDVEKKKKRVAQEEDFISLELQKTAAEIKTEEARGEAVKNVSSGVRSSLEGVGEAAKNGDLFD